MLVKKIIIALVVALVVATIGISVAQCSWNPFYLGFEKIEDSNKTLTPGRLRMLDLKVNGNTDSQMHVLYFACKENFGFKAGRKAELWQSVGEKGEWDDIFITESIIRNDLFKFEFSFDFNSNFDSYFYVRVDLTEASGEEDKAQLNMVGYEGRGKRQPIIGVLPIIGNLFERP
ncbi:MAG: hypothetical protein V1692_00025 [bacterium]